MTATTDTKEITNITEVETTDTTEEGLVQSPTIEGMTKSGDRKKETRR